LMQFELGEAGVDAGEQAARGGVGAAGADLAQPAAQGLSGGLRLVEGGVEEQQLPGGRPVAERLGHRVYL
jgi:hypothetical protein